MNWLEPTLIYSHVFAGASVLLSGLVAMLTPKGGRGHRMAGQLYFWGMFWIFASAFLLISMVRFNIFLLVIGVFSFYLAFSGFRVLKRKLPGQQGWIDWGVAIFAITAGLGLLFYGLYMLIGPGRYSFIIYPIFCILFGFFTFNAARTDVRFFLNPELISTKQWWWYHHMQAMLGSYIAAVTAFLVQGGAAFLPDWDMSWIFWLLPAAIGSPLISRWVNRYKRQFGNASDMVHISAFNKKRAGG